MTPSSLIPSFVTRLLPALAWVLASMAAQAQADPPGRIARLNHSEGSVVFSPAGDNEWTDAKPNRPLTTGDRIWTDRNSRAELHVGSTALRMDGQTHLNIATLNDHGAQLSVTQGAVSASVRSLLEGENFELDTPNLALRAVQAGEFRVDVDTARGTTRVTVHSGVAVAYGEGGESLPMGAGQQIAFKGRTLTEVARQEAAPQDTFDRWAAERDRREDQSISARYVPREVTGYQQLDAHGDWVQDANQGVVWYPRVASGWAPYRNGHWDWIAPWGWTWIDEAPWAFAPSHYGRWAQLGTRWAWVPGRMAPRPVYAPALVAFIGGGGNGVTWNIQLGAGRPAVAWFPLAPGEAWRPAYKASPVYLGNVNRNAIASGAANGVYVHQRRAEALTAILAEDFHRGRPVRQHMQRVPVGELAKAQVVSPPNMPTQSGFSEKPAAQVAKAAPPVVVEQRQVIALREPVRSEPAAAVAQVAAVERQRREQTQRQQAEREKAQREQAAKARAQTAAAAQVQKAQAQKDAVQRQLAQRQQAQREQQAMREKAQRQQAQQLATQRQRAEQDRAREHQQRVLAMREQAGKQEMAHREQVRRAEQSRREEIAQREAWQRQQQALSEQWKRDHDAWQDRVRQQQASQERQQRPQQAWRRQQAQQPVNAWPPQQQGVPILR